MNIFRSLLGKVWHDPNAAEIGKIESGQLDLVRPGNIRSNRECIFHDAMATVRRVPGVEHHFQIVITRAYEEGDQELLEDEEETDEERAFLISQELEFRMVERDGSPVLIWRDLDGDVDEVFEFLAVGANAPTVAFFETCMYRAMYERKYRRSADNTSDDDLSEFIWKEPVKPSRSALAKPKSTAAEAKAKAKVPEPAPEPEPERTPSPAPQAEDPQVDARAGPPPSWPAVINEPAEVFKWDVEESQYFGAGEVRAQVVHRPEDTQFQHHIAIIDQEGYPIILHPINASIGVRFNNQSHSFTWSGLDEKGILSSYCLVFTENDALRRWLDAVAAAMWEVNNEMPWAKAKSDEQAYVLSSVTEDVNMGDPEDDEEEEEDVENELDPDNEPSDEEEEGDVFNDEDEDENQPRTLSKGERNSQLTVGYKGDRSYVVRGNKIGVFRHSSDNDVKYHATIGKISTKTGKAFAPEKVMLHEQDTKMILMNPDDPHSLYSLDLEMAKIVEEWKIHDDVPVSHITPESKFAPTTHEQTLVGASGNALFRIDPRVSGTKMVDSQFKQYATKQKFSGVTTTASGKLAVGSEKGEIRLFDAIGKNAKTALPPLGDPILGIDATADGRFIVATTKTYLLLIDTLIGEGRYAGSLGFDRSFPATSKPIPKRLQLRAEHVAYMGSEVSFTPARFNMGEGQEENAIVTSSGPFVIAWDFAKVKKGNLDKYEIKKYEDMVVQDSFKFGDDKQIIVALQNNVLAINKKNLKRPTRASLAPPRQSLNSRSDIVNAPY